MAKSQAYQNALNKIKSQLGSKYVAPREDTNKPIERHLNFPEAIGKTAVVGIATTFLTVGNPLAVALALYSSFYVFTGASNADSMIATSVLNAFNIKYDGMTVYELSDLQREYQDIRILIQGARFGVGKHKERCIKSLEDMGIYID